MSASDLLKIEFYVPEEQLEQVKQAMFDAGAGRVGNYDYCAWQVLGQGQFRPGEGSTPFKGVQGKVERLVEYKVEMVCAQEFAEQAIEALKESHPYEEVAYSVFRTEAIK
tara:strand:- start:7997 stop:8326 length:330 start_codon:yes stop_codon:yes gene_type:complete